MNSVDGESIFTGRIDWIDADLARELAEHPVESVETEFPHWIGAVDSSTEFDRPKERHPVFYGSFDWHSAVHSHWCLIRLLRLFDDHPDETRILNGFDDRFTDENVATEVAYFEENESFVLYLVSRNEGGIAPSVDHGRQR